MKRVWVLLVVLAACAPPLEEPAEPGVEEVGDAVDTEEDEGSGVDLILGPCGGDEVQDLVGTALTDAGDRIPEDARRIAPGDVVTQDYRPKRMNVFTDGKGQITAITCG